MANDVDAYLETLPEDRRATLRAVRALVLENLPSGYQESMTWRMPTYEVPIERFPHTYNGKPLMYAAFEPEETHVAPPHVSLRDGRDRVGFPKSVRGGDGPAARHGRGLPAVPHPRRAVAGLIGSAIGSVDVDTFVELATAARSGRR